MPRLSFSVRAFSIFAWVAILYLVPSFSQAPDSDFQVWNETTLSIPIIKTTDESGKESDKLSLVFIGVLRLGQNRLFPTDTRVGAGFDYKINKYLSFTPTYVFRRGEPLRNSKEYEHRLRFDLTVGDKWKNFEIKDRSRIEYRIRNSRGDSVRYRNKFTFSVPIKRDGKEVFSPFTADEIYYDFQAKEFSTNEISAGIAKKFDDNFSAEFFYVRRDFRNQTLRFLNGVGVNLKFRID